MNSPCISCKGKGKCGRNFCPINEKIKSITNAVNLLDKDEFCGTSPPSVFVGRAGYPKVNVGILAPAEETQNAWIYDSPEYWADKGYSIKEIIGFRSSLINSRFSSSVKKFDGKLLNLSQEVAMAYKPVDMEVTLNKIPKPNFHFEQITLPMGPTAELKKVELTSNPKISNAVEKVYRDTDLKAADAVSYLYGKKFDLNTITKLFSIGTLGLKQNRKLVPTRWSITATHDVLGKNLISKIKDYQTISEYYYYSGNYLGNYYFILFFPEIWSYELFESYMPQSLWNANQKLATATDIEFYEGRKNYADETVGGYYSARLPILNKLLTWKKQASVLVFRFVTSEYSCPLGVWVVNEAVKKSLFGVPFRFSEKNEMLRFAASDVNKKFGYNLENLFKRSRLLNLVNTQKKLLSFN